MLEDEKNIEKIMSQFDKENETSEHKDANTPHISASAESTSQRHASNPESIGAPAQTVFETVT